MRLLRALAVLPLTLALVLGSATAQSTSFVETFDGRPSRPQNWDGGAWSITTFGVNGRQPNLAQHGPNCEPPGFPYRPENSHPFSEEVQATFICNDHMMTSLGITGYGAVYMTPPVVGDLSQGTVRIAWDMSTLRTSSRDWIYLVLTPFAGRHELAYINTDQHIPPENIKVELGGSNTFIIKQTVAGREARVHQDDDFHTWNNVMGAFGFAESAQRRDTFEITLTRQAISLCMPEYTFCWANNDRLNTPIDWSEVAVQIVHVTYNAEKACEDGAIAAGLQPEDQLGIVHNAYGDEHCPPNTWHWDNVTVSPALPVGVVPSVPVAAERNRAAAGRVDFAAPAPAGSFLSFVSFGDTAQLQVSFDGQTWQVPRLQPATSRFTEVGEQVWMPMPEGQQSIWVRGANGYWGSFSANNFKIVSPPASGTTSSVPPTATPTASPVVTPTPRPSSTATPTATVAPSPTTTSSPTGLTGCRVRVELNGTEGPWRDCQ